ncbi:hypothetical protein Tco_0496899 [Tanacetum coccineum]
MDRLSKRKFGIVCHGKVVRIPLEGDEILRVHGERTQGVSSVKDKILATSSETSKVENTPAEMLCDLDQQMKKRTDDVKPRRVRAMAMTLQYGVRGMILAAQSEAFKQENFVGNDEDCVVWDEASASNESVSDAIRFELGYMLSILKRMDKVNVLDELGDSSFVGPLVGSWTTDKVGYVDKSEAQSGRGEHKSGCVIIGANR